MFEILYYIIIPIWLTVMVIVFFCDVTGYVVRNQMTRSYRKDRSSIDISIDEWPKFAKDDTVFWILYESPNIVWSLYGLLTEYWTICLAHLIVYAIISYAQTRETFKDFELQIKPGKVILSTLFMAIVLLAKYKGVEGGAILDRIIEIIQ